MKKFEKKKKENVSRELRDVRRQFGCLLDYDGNQIVDHGVDRAVAYKRIALNIDQIKMIPRQQRR